MNKDEAIKFYVAKKSKAHEAEAIKAYSRILSLLETIQSVVQVKHCINMLAYNTESFKPDEKPAWHYFYNPQSRRVFYDNPIEATNH